MAVIEIDDELWAEFCSLAEQEREPDPQDYLVRCLQRTVQLEGVADGRYAPVASAIVMHEGKLLVVGNAYAEGKPLVWNLPGGAVKPGEDLRHAAARELYEETGLEAVEVGRLAWIVQVYRGRDRVGFLAFAFEVPSWRGEITTAHEERFGDVRRAEFLPATEACERIFKGNRHPLRDWLAAPRDEPRVYWHDREAGAGPQPIR